jgi:hypothetical protein
LHIDIHLDMWHAARMPSTAPAIDTSNWPTITAAATQLGTGERTVRRWIESGRIKTAERPAPGRKPFVICDPEDIARVREELTPVLLRPEAAADPPVSNDTGEQPVNSALARKDQFSQFDQFARLVVSIQNARVETRPWLTIEEASKASGLSETYLLARAREGWAAAVKGGRKGSWRFNREGLAACPK